MPKGRFAIKPGVVTVNFHPPIEPEDFGSRECLMEKVRAAIDSGLPEECREAASATKLASSHEDDNSDVIGGYCLSGELPERVHGYSFRVFARSARAISGSFDSSAEYFSHNLWSTAGAPLTSAPAGIS
jgi:hypothetical protein